MVSQKRSLDILGPKTGLSKSKKPFLCYIVFRQFILTMNIDVCSKSNSSTFYSLKSRSLDGEKNVTKPPFIFELVHI